MYVVLGWGYTQEDTLTNHLCYHTHGKLIFNWRLMHPFTYMYSQYNISNLWPSHNFDEKLIFFDSPFLTSLSEKLK